MARRLRVEYEGALYHVMSRGNYRTPVFEDERTKRSFIRCMFEACTRAGWELSAFVVMQNHYHLALKTPQANLSAGMHWLQSTFGTRFNRLRRESGHVFQGRFKAILVETEADLAAVAHYIHLNPVRAKIVSSDGLHAYPHSSYAYFREKNSPSVLDPRICLNGAGELANTAAGWTSYSRYLEWLAESEGEQKRLRFQKMSRGWILGTPQFKRTVAVDLRDKLQTSVAAYREVTEAKVALCEHLFKEALRRLGRSAKEIRRDRKSADWKVAVATQLKRFSTAKNPWIARQLNMGDPDGVSRYVAEYTSGKRPNVDYFIRKITDIRA